MKYWKEIKFFLNTYWGLQIILFFMILDTICLDFSSMLGSYGLFIACAILCFIKYDKEAILDKECYRNPYKKYRR